MNLIRMGVRLYDAQLGRFLQVDSIEGGSANAYDYCFGDPTNCWDLNGMIAWRDRFGDASKVLGIAAGLARYAAPFCVACYGIVLGASLAVDLGIAVYDCNRRSRAACRAAWIQFGINGVGSLVVTPGIGEAVKRSTRGYSGVNKVVRGKTFNKLGEAAETTVAGTTSAAGATYGFADASTRRR